MGFDVVGNIRRYGDAIKYVHFRDVRGSVPKFQETFHDNGPTDMAAAIRAYVDIGFDGPIRPDHVPVLQGESTDYAGYTMLGRLHAIGYMQGLIESARASS
jgi:mannonate dehydratase